MNTQPPTPRTDASALSLSPNYGGLVTASFARTLELETIELKEQVKMLREALETVFDEHKRTMQEVSDIGYSEGLCLKPSLRDSIVTALASTNPNRDVKQVSPNGRW